MIPYLQKSQNLAPVIPDRAMLHEMACTAAEERFKLKGEMEPTWVLAVGPNVGWIGTPFGRHDKRVTTMLVRDLLRLTGAQAYSFVSEVFVAALGGMPEEERKTWIAFANEHGVSALPAKLRDDALMVMSHDRRGGVSIARYLVTLRKGKGPNFLGPRVDETDEIGGMAGPMFNLFEPERDI